MIDKYAPQNAYRRSIIVETYTLKFWHQPGYNHNVTEQPKRIKAGQSVSISYLSGGNQHEKHYCSEQARCPEVLPWNYFYHDFCYFLPERQRGVWWLTIATGNSEELAGSCH